MAAIASPFYAKPSVGHFTQNQASAMGGRDGPLRLCILHDTAGRRCVVRHTARLIAENLSRNLATGWCARFGQAIGESWEFGQFMGSSCLPGRTGRKSTEPLGPGAD